MKLSLFLSLGNCLVLSFLFIVTQPAMGKDRTTDRLNFVFILADDLGYGELGCFGQELIKTPQLDRLAARGMRLTSHYAGAPVCAPSRCVLLTGRHLAQAEIRGNRDSGNGNEFPGQWPLSSEATTFAELLQRSGYATGCFGKWGLGAQHSSGTPLDQGFDQFFGYLCQRHAHSYYPGFLDENRGVRALSQPAVPGHRKQLAGDVLASDYRSEIYAPDLILEQARKFIRENNQKPFLLYLPLIEPHVAIHPPQTWIDRYPPAWDQELGPYRGENGYLPHPRSRAAYAAMISHLDAQVGQILDELQAQQLENRTVVIFTSDNGPTHGGRDPRFSAGGAACEFFHSNGGLRGAKGSCYEGGLRVPAIVYWPGWTRPGSESAEPTWFPDWYPTLCSAAQVEGWSSLELCGTDLSPVLQGHSLSARAFPFVWDFSEYGGIVAIRDRDWKAVRRELNTGNPQAWELYDLARDPREQTDLAARYPEIWKRLEREFLEMRQVEPDFPNRVYDPLTAKK